MSSLTNFVLGALIARSVSAEDFGVFGIAFTTYVTVLGVSRAIATEPFVVRYPGASVAELDRGMRAATGTALAVGAVVGTLIAVAGTAIGGTLGGAIVILGVLLPGLLLQDCWRFVFFARRMGASAFLNDLMWALVLIPAVLLAVSSGHDTIGWLLGAWGGAAAVAAVLGLAQSHAVPRPQDALRWMREERDLVAPFFAELAVRSAVGLLRTYGIG
ncbi:MAG: hypothetical protein ABR525_10370, partial [Candidatus Limnocylindria bacterium]